MKVLIAFLFLLTSNGFLEHLLSALLLGQWLDWAVSVRNPKALNAFATNAVCTAVRNAPAGTTKSYTTTFILWLTSITYDALPTFSVRWLGACKCWSC